MNRTGFALAIVAALCVSGSASAAWACSAPGLCTETQALTRAIPSISTPRDWVSLSGVKRFRLSVCADGGTLSGAGTMQAYLKGATAPERNKSLDAPVNVTATDCQGAACACVVFPDFEVGVGVGEFMFATNGITVSAGATVTVKLQAVK